MERYFAGHLFFHGIKNIAAAGLIAAAAQVPSFRAPSDFHTYYLLLLTKGPAWSDESAGSRDAIQSLQRAHVMHLSALALDGTLLIAGSVNDSSALKGIAILNAASLDDARTAEAGDPAVVQKRLVAEVLPIAIAGNWFAFAPLSGDQAMRQFMCVLLTTPVNASSGLNAGSAPPGADPADSTAHLVLEARWRQRESGSLLLAAAISGSATLRGLRVYGVDDRAAVDALVAAESLAVPTLADVHPWLTAENVLAIVR